MNEAASRHAENVEQVEAWRELKERALEDAAAELFERTGVDLDAVASPEKITALKTASAEMSEVDPETGFAKHNELRFAAREIAARLVADEEAWAAQCEAEAEAVAVPFPQHAPDYAAQAA